MAKHQFDWASMADQIKKEEESKKSYTKDTRLWKPVVKDGVCSAVIRFLPSKNGETFIHYSEHSFDYVKNSAKKRYWKKCINDFGYDRECPICTKNMEYYNSVSDEDKKIASARGRKHWYVANILVVQHKARPEDEGKVFLFAMGKSIFEKLKKKMNPSEEDKAAPDYFAVWPFEMYNDNPDFQGANFFITSKKQGEFANGIAMPNYEESRFLPTSPLFGGDEAKIDEVFEQTYPLDTFIDEASYPKNDEVIKVVGHLLGILPEETQTTDHNDFTDGPTQNLEDFFGGTTDDGIPEFTVPETAKQEPTTEPPFDVDDDAAYFASLTKGQ